MSYAIFDDVETIRDTFCPPILTILVGVPGSGKTTYAKKMLEHDNDTVHISSDAIRKRLYGDENCQNDPSKVFSIMQEETLDALSSGHNVIYDATSVTRKSRASILDKVPKYVSKYCVVVWAPIGTCIMRDSLRDRSVGSDVIHKMLRRFEAPFYDEGFETIEVIWTDDSHEPSSYYQRVISDMNIPHDNPHHSTYIIEHCKRCGMGLEHKSVPGVVKKSGYLHDIGKPITKSFQNRKGELTDIAHYYGHQAVGAWMSYGFDGKSETLAWIISTHMAPFINQKYYNSLPEYYKNWIDALHQADRSAH